LITFKQATKQVSIGSSRVNNRDLIMFCFQLEQLTSTGVPLLEGLTDLRDSTVNPTFKKVIGALVADVEGGKMLSTAMADHPSVFSDVFVSLVNAGEQAGRSRTPLEYQITDWHFRCIRELLVAYFNCACCCHWSIDIGD